MKGNRLAILMIFLGVGLVLIPGSPVPASAQSAPGRLGFSAFRNGQWDIYSVSEADGSLRQITNDVYEDRDPAYSPDGLRIAYASRRDGNWDVYVLDMAGGGEIRVTQDAQYDGAPAWNPDGTHLAFESFRTGDLDVWMVDLESGQESDLTPDSSAGDFDPAWAPDGERIAFSSWRNGNKDLFLLEVGREGATQLTDSPEAEESPVWSPLGDGQLAFVRNWLGDREVFAMDASPTADSRQVTWLGRDDSPVWSPDGQRLAFVTRRYDGEQLGWLPATGGNGLPTYLTQVGWIEGDVDWHGDPTDAGEIVAGLDSTGPSPLFIEDISPSQSPDGEPWDLLELANVQLPTPDMTPYLSDLVDDSYVTARERLAGELGYDYLGELSEAYRPVQFYSDVSEYASWHKSGRAIDMVFDVKNDDGQAMEIVRDDRGGETYWRVMLRCLAQDGSCGRPLTDATWNYGETARTELGPDQGGVEKGEVSGYYVDLAQVMREYGWTRISSWDSPEFSWTWHFKGFEYWHFQKSEGMPWYQAMQQVIAPEKLEQLFTYQDMRQKGDPAVLIALKGVPLPAEARAWWGMLQP